MLKKKCELCGKSIAKEKVVNAKVKVPEHNEPKEKSFCCEEHAESYKECITGTKRTSYCPCSGF